MKKTTEDFLKKMKDDTKFAEKVNSQTEVEKVIEIATTEGLELTKEHLDELYCYIKESAGIAEGGELTDKEMEQVTGGGSGMPLPRLLQFLWKKRYD